MFKRTRPKRKGTESRNLKNYEALEPRQLLNASPVAIHDSTYYTPTNTALVISDPNEGVLANDFDAEGSSLTATAFTSPANGSLVHSPDGTFTYTPDPGFTGVDTYRYKSNDGFKLSLFTEVTISVGTALAARQNADARITGNLLDNGVLSLSQPLGSGIDLVYRSDTIPVAIVPLETILTPGTPTPDSITANLTVDGISSGNISFGSGNVAGSDEIRIALRALTNNSSTGMHDWTMDVTLNYAGSSEQLSFTGRVPLVNRVGTEFGTGWWLNGLDRVYPDSSGTLLVNGDGTTLYFEKNGSNYDRAAGDLTFSTLTEDSNGFTLTDKWGNERLFDTAGFLLSSRQRANSVADFTFQYDASDRIDTITDQFGRTFTFTYQSGQLDTINDFAGRQSSLSYSSDTLKTVAVATTAAAGDFITDFASPTWNYRYKTIGGKPFLDRVTDPASKATTYFYTLSNRRLRQVDDADGGQWNLYPTIGEGFAHKSGTTVLKTSNLNSRYIDQRAKTYRFHTDDFGNVTYFRNAVGAETTFEFDDQSLLYRVTGPDPDGNGGPVTKFGHSFMGDLLRTVNPDGSSSRATYFLDYHQVNTFFNELNETQKFTYDTNGDLLTFTDAESNVWSYTWDGHGNLLTESTPAPDPAHPLQTITTTYNYETSIYNRVSSIVFEDNTSVAYTYTEGDRIATITDELSRVTTNEYDPLDRLARSTAPDPDGPGMAEAPVYRWIYGANLLLEKEIDARGQQTTYAYNNRHLLTTVTLPDPDASPGILPSPVYEYDYNATGQMISETQPEFDGVSITYNYDNLGRLLTVFGPVAGQTYRYTYDTLNRVVSTTDQSGRKTEFEYDISSRLTKVSDDDPAGGNAAGPETTFDYDDVGRLIAQTDPIGRTLEYSYFKTGWLKTATLPDPDRDGAMNVPVYSYEYDSLGRRVSMTDPAGREAEWIFDSRHRIIEAKNFDPDGDQGSLSATSKFYSYDNAGRLEQMIDELGRITAYGYDDLDRLTSLTLPDPDTGATGPGSPVYTYTYDIAGNLKTSTDPLGRTTSNNYDFLNRIQSVSQPAVGGSSPRWTYQYNDRMLLAESTNPEDTGLLSTTYDYDAAGRMISTTDQLGNTTSYDLDLLNRTTRVTSPDPDGNGTLAASTVDYTFDLLGRLISTTDSNSGVTSQSYDAAGQLLTVQDASGNLTSFAYDPMGRMTMDTNELGDTRSYLHNSVGRLVRVTDRNGRVTRYTRDGYTRAENWYVYPTEYSIDIATTSDGNPGNETQTVTLAAGMDAGSVFRLSFNGEITSTLDIDTTSAAELRSALEQLDAIDNGDVTVSGNTSNGFSITFGGQYAGINVPRMLGDVIGTTDGQVVNTIEYVYDEVFNLISVDDDVVDYTFGYDELNRVTEILEQHQTRLSPDIALGFEYDNNGNRLQMDAVIGGTADYVIDYEYDALDRLHVVKQRDTGLAASHVVADKMVRFNYNQLGQTTFINRFENLNGSNPALRTAFTYDDAHRIEEIGHRKVASGGASSLLHRYQYEYDDMGRFTEIDSTMDGVSTYSYDARSQLTSVDHAAFANESYGYDATGNRTGGAYLVGDNNQTLRDAVGATYQYDAEGNRIRKITGPDSFE